MWSLQKHLKGIQWYGKSLLNNILSVKIKNKNYINKYDLNLVNYTHNYIGNNT